MTPIMPAPANGSLWRYVLLDATDPTDPKWVLLTVAMPGDVRPADRDDRDRPVTDWAAVAAWVRGSIGRSVTLVPLDPDRAQLWRVDEGGTS